MSRATCPVHGKEYVSMGYGVLACPVKNCNRGTTVTALEDAQDKELRKPIKEKGLEADLDAEITQRLELMRYEVLTIGGSRRGVECTNCHTRSYGNNFQGNTEGTPDKFIRGKEWPVGVYVAVELKGSETAVRPAQQTLCDQGGSYICRLWEEVWQAVQATETAILEARLARLGPKRIAELREEHGL